LIGVLGCWLNNRIISYGKFTRKEVITLSLGGPPVLLWVICDAMGEYSYSWFKEEAFKRKEK
jgi:uncharacterized protein YodC (DUF2158 family)